MKKTFCCVLLILIFGSIIHAETFIISIVIPDAYKLNIAAPNNIILGVSEITSRTIEVASSIDSPWFQVEVANSKARVELSSLRHNSDNIIEIYVARPEIIVSVELWLVLCDVKDEALCFFIEERCEITESHRETGDVTVLLSLDEGYRVGISNP